MAALPANLLLVGGGHAHALVLKGFARRKPRGLTVTLVSDSERTIYSGMLPGHVAGEFRREEIEIDLARLAEAAGARFVLGRVAALDTTARSVTLLSGGTLRFDLCSLNVGAAKQSRVQLLAEIDRIKLATRSSVPRVLIVGAGAGGVEVALALTRRFGERINLTLAGKGKEPTPEFPRAAQAKLAGILLAAGIDLRLGQTVVDAAGLPYDHVIWLTGSEAPAWIAASGLAVDDRGYVMVDETLRSPSHPWLFAAGDAAVVANHPRPHAGVFAVRAAGPLEANLRAAAEGGAFSPYIPQATYLALLVTGRKTALGVKGSFVLHGRPLRYLKNRIDRAFIRSLS